MTTAGPQGCRRKMGMRSKSMAEGSPDGYAIAQAQGQHEDQSISLHSIGPSGAASACICR